MGFVCHLTWYDSGFEVVEKNTSLGFNHAGNCQGCKCECACFMRDRYCPNCGHVRFMCLELHEGFELKGQAPRIWHWQLERRCHRPNEICTYMVEIEYFARFKLRPKIDIAEKNAIVHSHLVAFHSFLHAFFAIHEALLKLQKGRARCLALHDIASFWNAGHLGLSFPGPTRVGWRHKKDQCIYGPFTSIRMTHMVCNIWGEHVMSQCHSETGYQLPKIASQECQLNGWTATIPIIRFD